VVVVWRGVLGDEVDVLLVVVDVLVDVLGAGAPEGADGVDVFGVEVVDASAATGRLINTAAPTAALHRIMRNVITSLVLMPWERRRPPRINYAAPCNTFPHYSAI
jgi:hypothetical protein